MTAHERKHSPEPEDGTEFVDELQPGTPLMSGQYVIRDFLNAGGFGITYLATDSLDRTVVIKECFPGTFCRRSNVSVQPRSRAHLNELRSIVRLFANEAHSLARVGHKNIVGVHHVFEENNTAYMALDFVNGRDLLDIIEDPETNLTPAQIRTFLEKMLDAIGFVHREGMLHRDISPDNIIIRQDGEPVLIDFGAAREQATKASRVLSALRVVKDGYSPQEFYISGSEQSPSCDLYSLAASFYHVITGGLPPDSQKRLQAFASSEPDPYVPLGQRTDAFDAVFCAALDKAMSVLPKERMQSAEEWLAAMRGEALETVGSEPEAPRAVVPVRPVLRAAGAERPVADEKAQEPTTREVVKPAGSGTFRILVGSTALVAIAAGAFFLSSMQNSQDVARSVPEPATITAATSPEAVATPVVTPAPATAATSTPEPTVVPNPKAAAEPETETATATATATGTATTRSAPVIRTEPLGIELKPFSARPATVATVRPIPTPAPVPRTEATDAFVSRPVLPFSADPADPARIGTVTDDAPTWAAPGLRIVTSGGEDVASLDEAVDRAAQSLASDDSEIELVLGVSPDAESTPVEHRLTVPVAHELTLANGLGFRTGLEDGVWVTRVTATADGVALAEGDVVAADMRDNTLIDGPDTLMRVIGRAMGGGESSITFAVRRGNTLYVETFQLTAM